MKCWEFNVEADSECISLKYSPHHLASQYGIELEQLQMAAYRGAIYPEYKIQIHHDIQRHFTTRIHQVEKDPPPLFFERNYKKSLSARSTLFLFYCLFVFTFYMYLAFSA